MNAYLLPWKTFGYNKEITPYYEKPSFYIFHAEYILYPLYSWDIILVSNGRHARLRQPSLPFAEWTLSLLGSCGDSIRAHWPVASTTGDPRREARCVRPCLLLTSLSFAHIQGPTHSPGRLSVGSSGVRSLQPYSSELCLDSHWPGPDLASPSWRWALTLNLKHEISFAIGYLGPRHLLPCCQSPSPSSWGCEQSTWGRLGSGLCFVFISRMSSGRIVCTASWLLTYKRDDNKAYLRRLVWGLNDTVCKALSTESIKPTW